MIRPGCARLSLLDLGFCLQIGNGLGPGVPMVIPVVVSVVATMAGIVVAAMIMIPPGCARLTLLGLGFCLQIGNGLGPGVPMVIPVIVSVVVMIMRMIRPGCARLSLLGLRLNQLLVLGSRCRLVALD